MRTSERTKPRPKGLPIFKGQVGWCFFEAFRPAHCVREMMRRGVKRPRNFGRVILDIYQREVGDVSPTAFQHHVRASEDLVLRLGIHLKLAKHKGCVNSVCFNPDGDILVSGSDDRMIMLWDWNIGLVKLQFFSGHSNNIFQAQIMPYTNDKTVVSCAADGEVRLARILEDGQVATTLLGRHESRAMKIVAEPGSPHIFYSCGQDGALLHFDLRTKSASKLLVCNSFEDKSDSMPIVELNVIAIDPRNPHLFAVGGSDEYCRVYDIRKYRCDGSTKNGQPADCFCPIHLIGVPHVGITGLAFSDQSELLISYNEELIYLFSKDQGLGSNPLGLDYTTRGLNVRLKPQAYWGHKNRDTLKGVSFLGPNCEYVASGSDCGRLFIWRKRGGELLRVMAGDKHVVNCIGPHPYATVFASSGIESDIKIWTPNAVNPAQPVNMDEFLSPFKHDYCIVADYDGEEDDNDDDDPEDDADCETCDSESSGTG